MKFICPCETLRKEISYASNFTTKRNALSITSNVLLENKNNTLTIKATDSKNGFISSIEVNTIVPGSTTVLCDKFLDVLKNINGDVELEISQEKENLSIKNSSESKFIVNIRTVDSDKFPEMIEYPEEDYFTVGQNLFFDMIDKTSYAVGHEESRFFLTGVYMEYKNDKLVMVATDGKRLNCVRRSFEQEIGAFVPSIVPVNFLNNLKMIGSGDGVLSLSFKNGYAFASIEGRYMYSLLITGNYPNYERVIPKSFEYKAVASTSEMLDAINLISVTIEMKSKKIIFEVNGDGIMVSGEDSDGNSKNVVKCDYDGPEMKLSFNYNFLQDAIKKIESDDFAICFNNSNTAIGLLSEPESDYIFIIMPMQA